MPLLPTSVAVICQSRERRGRIERALANDARVRLSGIRRTGELPLNEQSRNFPDVLIFCLHDLQRSPSDLAISISRRTAMVIALDADDVLCISSYATVADGWLFLDEQIPLSAQIALLSRDRYCLVPHFLSPAFSVGGLREQMIDQLTETETRVLERLGAGSANREIAACLGISESHVKYLVRNVLAKLQLPNRTSAAVFVHSSGREAGTSRPIDRGSANAKG